MRTTNAILTRMTRSDAAPTLWKTITGNCNYITQWISKKVLALAAAAIASAKNNETHSLLFCSSCPVPPSICLGCRVIAIPKIVFGDDVHAWAEMLQQNTYAESKCILHINCFRIGRKCLLRRSVLIQTHHQSEAISYKISTFCFVDSNSASLLCVA